MKNKNAMEIFDMLPDDEKEDKINLLKANCDTFLGLEHEDRVLNC